MMSNNTNTFYVTNGVTQDGFGARLQRCLQVMCFVYQLQSEGAPVEYVHTPFSYDADTPLNEDPAIGVEIRSNFTLANPYPYNDIEYDGYMTRARLWDKALSFNGKTAHDLDLTKLTIKEGVAQLAADLKTNDTTNGLYVIKYLHSEYDSQIIDINNFHTYNSKLLRSFNCFTNINNSGKDIAIHIRRKDCLDKVGRFIGDDVYLSLLEHLKKLKQTHNITIYTQEVGFNADLYTDWSVKFDTVMDDYEVFKKLVLADHLIVGGSSFSYAAALLNPNTVVYHYNGHIPLIRWVNYDNYIKLIEKL
jgi:hypothetical protein